MHEGVWALCPGHKAVKKHARSPGVRRHATPPVSAAHSPCHQEAVPLGPAPKHRRLAEAVKQDGGSLRHPEGLQHRWDAERQKRGQLAGERNNRADRQGCQQPAPYALNPSSILPGVHPLGAQCAPLGQHRLAGGWRRAPKVGGGPFLTFKGESVSWLASSCELCCSKSKIRFSHAAPSTAASSITPRCCIDRCTVAVDILLPFAGGARETAYPNRRIRLEGAQHTSKLQQMRTSWAPPPLSSVGAGQAGLGRPVRFGVQVARCRHLAQGAATWPLGPSGMQPSFCGGLHVGRDV